MNFLTKAVLSLMIVSGLSANAEEKVNFQCDIFATVYGEYAGGQLTLSGSDQLQQTFKLTITDSEDIDPKEFSGTLYLQGLVSFTDLTTETQGAINNAMKTSRRPNLKAGNLVVFSNTESADESTLLVYLMPSGEISYISDGFLPVLCM
jgi:hypothetical protein